MALNYSPQTWVDRETRIDAARMQHIEEGIQNVTQAVNALPSSPAASSNALTPEQFGAVGDGVVNDTEALKSAIQAASEQKQPLELTPGATYRFTEVLNPKDNLTIHGNGAALLSDIQWAKQAQDRPGIFIVGSKTDLVQHIRIDGLTFRAADTCQTNTMLRFQCSRDVQIRDCVFDCDINTQNRGCMDLYGVNHDFLFENNVFRQLSACKEGGIWVRNWTKDYGSSNIRFLHCDFYKAGGDEVFAVWGWGGTMEHVLISGCNFYEVDDEKYRARGFYPAWFLTLGQSNDNRTDVRMENCVIRANRCNALFREVVGNVFRGSLYGLFWDCDIVRDNVVELTNSGSAWMSGAGEVIGNQIKMEITADAQGGAIFHNNWNKGTIRDNKFDLTFAQECDVRQYDMRGGPQYVQNNIITVKGARYTHLENAINGLIYRKNNFFNNAPEKLFECTGVTFDEETRTEQYKKHTRLGVTISPEACTDPVVYTWEYADGALDVGEYGAYRPLKDGTASVTVSCGMFSASQKITVKLTPVPCEGLKLSRVTAKCGKGMSTYLKAFPQPYWTTDDVVWSSDAEDVVAVTQDGVVSALKTGTANITVTCGSFTVTCAVTAVEASELPTYTEGEWALDNTVAYIPMPNLEAEHTLYAAFDVDTNCVNTGEVLPLISSLLSGQTGQEAIKLDFGADGKNYKTVRWYTTDATSDEKGNTTLYSVTYVNTGFKEDEPASTAFLYLTSGVANPSGAVLWASQTSTVKAAPNSGYLSFNVQTSAEDTPITDYTSGAALAAALAAGNVHATKATGFKLKELILFTNASYTTLAEVKKYRENAEIDLRFDADGHPLNAGTAGDFVIAGEGGEIVPVSSVTLNKTTLSLTKGGTDTLTASVLPADATEKTVTWSVSPEGVVTLSGTTGSSITVTAAAAGECTITAAAGGKTVTCAVTAVEASELPTYTDGEWLLDNTVAYIPMPNPTAEHTLYATFDVDMNCVNAGEVLHLISSLLSGQTGEPVIKLDFGADGKNYKTVRWYTTSTEVDSDGNTTLYSAPYVNASFKDGEPASSHFLYLMSGVANPSGAVIWKSQTSTVKAAPNSGYLSFNVQTSADDTPIASFTSGAALAAALASGSVHATKATGFKLKELILFTNASYTTLDEVKKYRENAEIDLRFDADGHPLNAGTAGNFIIARTQEA